MVHYCMFRRVKSLIDKDGFTHRDHRSKKGRRKMHGKYFSTDKKIKLNEIKIKEQEL